MKVLIVGSGGRLGAALVREWRAAGEEVVGLNRSQLDLGEIPKIRPVLEPIAFDVMVNCAAQTNVDRCETHQDEAYLLNGTAVGALGDICRSKGARFVHISTDYVFNGEKRTPYTEEDSAIPISVYGTSKLLGENAALAATEGGALVVRVSWVFGPDRPSFVDQIVQKARQEEQVSAVADKWAVPTYTFDVAELLRPLLWDRSASGLLHLCNEGACTWQEYGQFALDCAAKTGMELKARTVSPLQMADLKAFIAKRPVYTAMATEKFTRLTGHAPRPWQDAVRSYIREHLAK